MSLTFLQVKNAKPLAKIIGDGKLHNKVVYIDPNTTEIDEVNNFSKLRIPNNCSFQIIPDTTHERDILYITGASGSGKSTFTRKYVEQYKKNIKTEKYIHFHI